MKTSIHPPLRVKPRAGHARARSQVSAGATNRRLAAVLSSQQRQRFDQDGYLALPLFCDAHEVTWLRSTLARLFREQIGREQGQQFDMLGLDVDAAQARQPQILKPSVFAPELMRSSYMARTFMLARQLLGPDAQFSFDHTILKPAGSAAATPWHQDEAHHTFRFLRYPQISFWLALQDTSIENGCMRYVPGSNRGPLLPHRRLNDDPRIHAIECPIEHFDEAQAAPTPVAAGTCILHSSLTLHSALPNISANDRIAYIVAFTGPPVAAEKNSILVSMPAGCTANVQRRHRWLLRGGFLHAISSRLGRVVRTSPRAFWLKLQALMQARWTPARRILRMRAR